MPGFLEAVVARRLPVVSHEGEPTEYKATSTGFSEAWGRAQSLPPPYMVTRTTGRVDCHVELRLDTLQ